MFSFKYMVTANSCPKCVSFQLRAICWSQMTPFAKFYCGTNHGAIWWIKKQWKKFHHVFFFIQILVKIQFVPFLHLICQAYCTLNRTNTVLILSSHFIYCIEVAVGSVIKGSEENSENACLSLSSINKVAHTEPIL